MTPDKDIWKAIHELKPGEELKRVPGTNKSLWTILTELLIFDRTAGGCSNVYGAYEVTLGSLALRGAGPYLKSKRRTDRIDYMTVSGLHGDGEIKCYELKATLSDLHSTAALSFVGDLNYLVVHPAIADAALDEMEPHIGIMTCGQMRDGRWEPRDITSIRKAKRVEAQITAERARMLMFRSMAYRINSVTCANAKNAICAVGLFERLEAKA